MADKLSVKVSITTELGPFWADNEDFLQMTNDEIIELVQEDITAFIEQGTWKVFWQIYE